MNTGVELLIKRLKDCPEDFHYDPTTDRSSKWNSLLMEALRSDVITEEEKVALRAEVTEMGRERFTKKVMQTLAGVEDETSEQGKYPTSSIGTGGLTLTADPTASSGLAWSNRSPLTQTTMDAQKYQTEMMRMHLDAHMKALKAQNK